MKSVHINVRAGMGFIKQVYLRSYRNRVSRNTIIQDAKNKLDMMKIEWTSAQVVVMHYGRDDYNTKNEYIEIWNEQ